MYPDKNNRNETSDRVFFGTGKFFFVFVIALVLYVLYDLYLH